MKQSRRLRKKLAVVFIIMFVYILGQSIPLPYVQINEAEIRADQTFVQLLQTINGSGRQAVSIFSIGILPYMMSSILLMLKNLGNSGKRRISLISPVKQTRLLALVICFVMAFLRTANYEYTTLLLNNVYVSRAFTIMILITGSFTIVWLADLNTGKGIGGMVVIIIVNIMKNIIRSVLTVWNGFQTGLYGSREDVSQIALLLAIGLISMLTILLLEESEFRIPIQKVMIYNEMAEDNYMALKLDPIGIQPMMYVMAFYIIPYYLLNILAYLFPDKAVFAVLAAKVRLDNLLGIGIFLILFFLLALALAMVQINPSELAEQMMKGGDCIIGLRPGKETQDYLRKTVLCLSVFSSIILGILIGLPLILKVIWGLPQELAMIPMSLMFIGGISRNIFLEIRVVKRLDSYQEVL